jgi:hypothetical protein
MRIAECGLKREPPRSQIRILKSAFRIGARSPAPTVLLAHCGEVQEWLNWQHWKCCVRGTVPWVRIPPSPPANFGFGIADLKEYGIVFFNPQSEIRIPQSKGVVL